MEGFSWFPVRLSLQVAAVSTLAVALLGTWVAFQLARKEFPGKASVNVLVTLPLLLPPTVIGYYLMLLLGRQGWLGGWLFKLGGIQVSFTWGGAVVASSVVALPLMVKTAEAAISSVSARYELTAYTLGRSRAYVAWRITLPLAWRGLLAGIILSFARAMGEFGATLILAGNIPGRTSTMPLAIYTAFASGDLARANLLAGIHTAFALLVLYLAQRWGRLRW